VLTLGIDYRPMYGASDAYIKLAMVHAPSAA